MTHTKDEALKLALDALELHGKQYPHMVKGYCLDAITAIEQALAAQPAVQEPKCNPHPKAPHGFSRNASHSADRYVCECEGWDAYDAGFQAGVEDTYKRIDALDRMAENARELGLMPRSGGDYEPVWCGHCNGSGRMVRDPDIGTDQECFVCDGAGVPSAPVQQSRSDVGPVAWVVEDEHGERLEWAGDAHSCQGLPTLPLYTAAQPAPTVQEPVARVHTFIGPEWAVVQVLGEFNLEDALYTAPPAQPTPVHFAWMRYEADCAGDPVLVLARSTEEGAFKVYKEPPAAQPAQRPWFGLTDEERDALWYRFGYMELMRAIEAKLKEKNL